MRMLTFNQSVRLRTLLQATWLRLDVSKAHWHSELSGELHCSKPTYGPVAAGRPVSQKQGKRNFWLDSRHGARAYNLSHDNVTLAAEGGREQLV